MSCSMNRTVTSRGSSRSRRTARRSRRRECRPPARRAAGSPAASRARARSRAAAACRRRGCASARCARASSCSVLEQRVGLVDRRRAAARPCVCQTPRAPLRSQTASTTDSSTVRPGNSVLIWNVRVMPRLTRSCCGSDVMLLVAEEHLARGRREHARQQVDERRLAGAVRADQRVPRAGRERQRHVAVGVERAPALGQALACAARMPSSRFAGARRRAARRSRARPGCRRARTAR